MGNERALMHGSVRTLCVIYIEQLHLYFYAIMRDAHIARFFDVCFNDLCSRVGKYAYYDASPPAKYLTSRRQNRILHPRIRSPSDIYCSFSGSRHSARAHGIWLMKTTRSLASTSMTFSDGSTNSFYRKACAKTCVLQRHPIQSRTPSKTLRVSCT